MTTDKWSSLSKDFTLPILEIRKQWFQVPEFLQQMPQQSRALECSPGLGISILSLTRNRDHTWLSSRICSIKYIYILSFGYFHPVRFSHFMISIWFPLRSCELRVNSLDVCVRLLWVVITAGHWESLNAWIWHDFLLATAFMAVQAERNEKPTEEFRWATQTEPFHRHLLKVSQALQTVLTNCASH